MAVLDAVAWRDPAALVPALLSLLVAWYVASSIAAWYPLRHVPGPKLASFSYLWKMRLHASARVQPTLATLRSYGPLVRVGPKYVLTDDPAELRRMEGVRSRYSRDAWYSAGRITPDVDMATTLDTAEHDRIKSKVLGGYQGRDNPDMEGAVDSQVVRFVELLRRKYLTEKLDFAPLSRFFTLDVVTRLFYGEPFGHLDEGEDVFGFVEAVDTAMKAMGFAVDVPGIRAIITSPLFQSKLGPKPSDKMGIGRVMGESQGRIDQRFKDPNTKTKQDMLGGLIRNGLTQKECESEAMLGILAGSDTTASTIRGILYCLITSPRVYHKLRDEIREVLSRGDVPTPIPYKDAKEMEYLQAVIWEAFRLHTPFTHGHYKVVPAGGDTVSGFFLPPGTAVGHNVAAIMQKESIFGDDIAEFRPERFLECDKAKRQEMDRAIDTAFGGGRWMCAGRMVAVMEMAKLFFELVRHFEFEFVDPEKPWLFTSYLTPHHLQMWVKVKEAPL